MRILKKSSYLKARPGTPSVNPSLSDHTLASIRDDPHMKLLGGYVTYNGKGVPNLIYEKMELGLKNIASCLVHDEHKVRIHKEYFLPTNNFILFILDLTHSDLFRLDALTHRFLKSWLGMPQSGSFLPVHSG